MSGLTTARLVAHVQRDAVGELPGTVTAVPHAVTDGVRRAASSLLLRGTGDLVHGLDVDLPLRHPGPRVVTIHDLSVFDVPWAHGRLRASGERRLVARAVRQADAVVAVSGFTAERVHALFGREATVTRLAPRAGWSATPAEVVEQVRQRYDLAPRSVLCVGTIEPRKRVDLLAEACDRAGGRLVLAGRLAPGEQVPAAARHLGYVPADDLPALFAAADAVAYASDYEGFGLPRSRRWPAGARSSPPASVPFPRWRATARGSSRRATSRLWPPRCARSSSTVTSTRRCEPRGSAPRRPSAGRAPRS